VVCWPEFTMGPVNLWNAPPSPEMIKLWRYLVARNLIDLRYYAPKGEYIGGTSYMSKMSNADKVTEEIVSMNTKGGLPGLKGRLFGYVTFDITSRRKDGQALVRLA